MIYHQELKIPSYLCDIDDRLHLWAAVRLCQEVTEYHGTATGIGFKVLLSQNRAWIISRAYYDIRRLPTAFEPVVFTTWSRGHNGLLAYRDYRVLTPAGEVLLTGTSYWAMIDMTRRRVLRLNELIEGYESHHECATEKTDIEKIAHLNPNEAQYAMQRAVSFGMLDHTRHVNNSEYIRLCSDLLHEHGFSTDHPFSLTVNYNHETRLGDTLNAYGYSSDTTHHLTISTTEHPCVTAIVKNI